MLAKIPEPMLLMIHAKLQMMELMSSGKRLLSLLRRAVETLAPL